MQNERYQLHGLKLSYFTGKLEGYFRAKGIPFDFIEMDRTDFRDCAEATGIAQMPQVQTPDGLWMTDTTAMIAHFEQTFDGPALTPKTPTAKFFSLLLEDLFDEWLWRPALYYRWVPKEDMRLLSSQAARTMLRDVKLPQRLRQQFIKTRQKKVYLDQDGVTKETASAIEMLYLGVLKTLEPIFSRDPICLAITLVKQISGYSGRSFGISRMIQPLPQSCARRRPTRSSGQRVFGQRDPKTLLQYRESLMYPKTWCL